MNWNLAHQTTEYLESCLAYLAENQHRTDEQNDLYQDIRAELNIRGRRIYD